MVKKPVEAQKTEEGSLPHTPHEHHMDSEDRTEHVEIPEA